MDLNEFKAKYDFSKDRTIARLVMQELARGVLMATAKLAMDYEVPFELWAASRHVQEASYTLEWSAERCWEWATGIEAVCWENHNDRGHVPCRPEDGDGRSASDPS